MKTLIITLATNEFVVRGRQTLPSKIGSRLDFGKGMSLGQLGVSARTSY